MNRRRLAYALAAPVAAAALSLIIASLALWVSGHSPGTAFRAMGSYVWTRESLVTIINKAVPYYISAVAVAIGFRMGLFNIGTDGQYRLAALLAGAAGAAVRFPALIHVAFIILVALAVGAAYAAIPGVLKVTRGVNEVIATIMLNSIATGIISYLVITKAFRDPKEKLLAETKPIPKSGHIPDLLHFKGGTPLRGWLIAAVLIGIFFYVLLFRTRFGYEVRASGINPAASLTSGVNPKAMVVKTIMLSGAIAAMAGMGPLLTEQFAYGDLFPTALGFTGIGIALLGRNHPAGIAVGAFVWAGIERATQNLSKVNAPQEISQILIGTLLMSAVIAYEVTRRRAEAAAIREAAGRAIAATPTALPAPVHQ
jgi:general nucleoside transport system permease protein